MEINTALPVNNNCSDSTTDNVFKNNDVEMKQVPLPVDNRLHSDAPVEDGNFKTKPSTSKNSYSDKDSDNSGSGTDIFVNTKERKKKKLFKKKISPVKQKKPVNNAFYVSDNDYDGSNSVDENTIKNLNRPGSNTETEIDDEDLPICFSQDLFNIDHLIISSKCPLCLKIFDKPRIITHVKKCAFKKKLSTKQLFDILKLQKKHDKEREAMGLSVVPEKTAPKRKRSTKMLTTGLGSNVELALALSKSEMEVREQNLIEEAENLAQVGLHDEAADKLQKLEKFGFSSSSSVTSDPTGKKKSKKPTLLLTRTQEEREKILTEKVAMVILDNEDKETEIDEIKFPEHSSPKSLKLRKHYDKNDGTNQLPGTSKETDESATLSGGDSGEPSSTVDLVSEQLSTTQNSVSENLLKEPETSKNTIDYLNTALREDDVRLTAEDQIFEEFSRTQTHILNSKNMKFINTFISNWKTIFRKKCFSDITVLTEGDYEIPVHRLVLYVRCCNILKSTTENKNPKITTPFIINWKEISKKAALIFLKYIYCGEFKDVFNQSGKIFDDILILIKQYKIKELDMYINEFNHDECNEKDKNFNNGSTNNDEVLKKDLDLPSAENLNVPTITVTNDDNNNSKEKQNSDECEINNEIISSTSTISVKENVASSSCDQSSLLKSNNIADSEVECNMDKLSLNVNSDSYDRYSDSDDTTISATSIENINLLQHFPIVSISPMVKIIERDEEIDCYDDSASNLSIISIKSASNETPSTQNTKRNNKSASFRIKPTPVQILRVIYDEDKRDESDDSDIEIITPKNNSSLNYYSSIQDSRNQVLARKTSRASTSSNGKIIECLIDSDSELFENINKVTDYDCDKSSFSKNSLSPDSRDASNLNYKKRMITEFENENNNNDNHHNYSNDDSNDCLILSEKQVSPSNLNKQSSVITYNENHKRKNLLQINHEDLDLPKKRKTEYEDIIYNYCNNADNLGRNSDGCNSSIDAAITSGHKKSNAYSFGSIFGKLSTQQNLQHNDIQVANADTANFALNSKENTNALAVAAVFAKNLNNDLLDFTKKLSPTRTESSDLSKFIKKEYDLSSNDFDMFRDHLSFRHEDEQKSVAPEDLLRNNSMTKRINSGANGLKPRDQQSLLNSELEYFKDLSTSKYELSHHENNDVPVELSSNNKTDNNFLSKNGINVSFNESNILSYDSSQKRLLARNKKSSNDDPTATLINNSSYGYKLNYSFNSYPAGPSHKNLNNYFNDQIAGPSNSFDCNSILVNDRHDYLVNDDVGLSNELYNNVKNNDYLIDSSLNNGVVYDFNRPYKDETVRPFRSSKVNDSVKVPSEPISLDDTLPKVCEQILKSPLSPDRSLEADSPRPVCIVTETTELPLNFDEMEDKEIEKRLEKYGIKKSLNKKNAIRLLKFIYDEIHPLLPEDILNDKVTLKKVAQSFCDNTIKLCENSNAEEDNLLMENANLLMDNDNVNGIPSDESSSDSEVMEEINEESEPDDVDENYSKANIGDVFKRYIRGNKELLNSVLLYKVVQLEDIVRDLHSLGIKFRIKDLMEELDKQGIVYQSNHRYNLRKRKPSVDKGVKPKVRKAVSGKSIALKAAATDDVNNIENHIPNGQNGFNEFERTDCLTASTSHSIVNGHGSPENKEWICGVCTLINKPLAIKCDACETLNPSVEEEKFSYEELIELENQPAVLNREKFVCAICFDDCEPGEGVVLRECLHYFCRLCLAQTVKNSDDVVVKCPYSDDNYSCQSKIQEREIKYIAPPEIVEQHHNKALALTENSMENTFHCKTPDCKMWCILDDVNDHQNMVFNCMACGAFNCIPCQAIHPLMNCLQYQTKLEMDAATDPIAKKTFAFIQKMLVSKKAMHCPKCNVIVMKSAGCDWIMCSMCRTEICWATLGPRWGPGGLGDTSGGCRCRFVQGKLCHPNCKNCH